MNYQHAYHAGGSADVFKHTVLVALIKALSKKPTGFCYIDTHAGAGLYDLFGAEKLKTQHANLGIEKLLHQKKGPGLIDDYIQAIHQINKKALKTPTPSLQYYPGSPMLVRHFLRPVDRMVLSELNPKEYRLLKKNLRATPKLSVHLMNGYQTLKAFLPPAERRGLILIDPPYEHPNELNDLLLSLSAALKRFQNGTYAIWYPIKDRSIIELFLKKLKNSIEAPLLRVELLVYPDTGTGLLNGSGMLVINPPWQLELQIAEFLPYLWKTLSQNGQGEYKINFL